MPVLGNTLQTETMNVTADDRFQIFAENNVGDDW